MKFITTIAIVMGLVSTPVLAQTFDVRATGGYVASDTGSDRYFVEGKIVKPVDDFLVLDGTLRNDHTDSTQTDVQRAEVGLTTFVGSYYVRGAAGFRWSEVSSDFGYWSVEPGMSYGVNDNLTVSAGIRYRNSFDRAQNYETVALTPRFTYELSNFNLTGGLDVVRGDEEAVEYRLGVSKSF